ncbi:arsenate reductase/protein-tyrosine-phosphatase family protein [Nitrococcus mobilis]|uniref:arsenate reductase/protein-tyrosine-phosphatase family protein n=1 Tax=Nitrococcus mobilis TaxID=35797 RepID=UPI0003209A3E
MELWKRWVRTPFGTHRGFIRLCLAWFELAVGRLERFSNTDLACVKRLVFVCLGNVCRSAYAEAVVRRKGVQGLSFGLSASTGMCANVDAISTAHTRGYDLGEHRSTDQSDFNIEEGDLLLVMEVRQARRIEPVARAAGAQVVLLGLWATPRRPHIHDPAGLSLEYFNTCFRVVESAVDNLVAAWQRARPSWAARAGDSAEVTRSPSEPAGDYPSN